MGGVTQRALNFLGTINYKSAHKKLGSSSVGNNTSLRSLMVAHNNILTKTF